VKRLGILLTPILIFAVVFGCSKDHEAPTYSTYKKLTSPDDFEATYDSAKDVVDLSWTMADTSGVIDFMVAVSDSSIFDDGELYLFPTNMKLDTAVSPYKSLYDASKRIDADVDSLIMYFTVSAIFDDATFNQFIGPRAVIDSALVLRK